MRAVFAMLNVLAKKENGEFAKKTEGMHAGKDQDERNQARHRLNQAKHRLGEQDERNEAKHRIKENIDSRDR